MAGILNSGVLTKGLRQSNALTWSRSGIPHGRLCIDVTQLTLSFSTKSMQDVLSISTGWPCRSYSAKTKWKKLDLRRLEGGCFSKWARVRPTPLWEVRGGRGAYSQTIVCSFAFSIFFHACTISTWPANIIFQFQLLASVSIQQTHQSLPKFLHVEAATRALSCFAIRSLLSIGGTQEKPHRP